MNPNPPKPKQAVLYWPSAAMPQGPLGQMIVKDSMQPMKGSVVHVHNPRLVDLRVTDHGKADHLVRFVPFLHDGDPDPLSPVGRCQLGGDRELPGAVTLNPGTAAEFQMDPVTGATWDKQSIGAGEVGSLKDVLG